MTHHKLPARSVLLAAVVTACIAFAPTSITDRQACADAPTDVGCEADLDGSGAVDFNDFLIVISNWGPCAPPAPCLADINGNGTVGFGDLIAVLINWGLCP
ncbi:MAG: hypothetical protein GY715_02850 [Planctomycetes bacterium]|nr:hypothetical protein [Planctomycetota bacterium]